MIKLFICCFFSIKKLLYFKQIKKLTKEVKDASTYKSERMEKLDSISLQKFVDENTAFCDGELAVKIITALIIFCFRN